MRCAACKSNQVLAQADRFKCLRCGSHTDFNGELREPGAGWTSDVSDTVARTAEVTVAAAAGEKLPGKPTERRVETPKPEERKPEENKPEEHAEQLGRPRPVRRPRKAAKATKKRKATAKKAAPRKGK